MIFKKSLALKLELFILSGTSLVFLGAFAYNYYFSRQMTLNNVRADMDWTAQ